MSIEDTKSSPSNPISPECSISKNNHILSSDFRVDLEKIDVKNLTSISDTKASFTNTISTKSSNFFTNVQVERLNRIKSDLIFIMLSPLYFILIFFWTGFLYPIAFILAYAVGPVLFFMISIFWGGCLQGFGMMILAEIVTLASSLIILATFLLYSLFVESPRLTRRMIIEKKMPYVSKDRNYWYEYWQIAYSKVGLVLENPYANDEKNQNGNKTDQHV